MVTEQNHKANKLSYNITVIKFILVNYLIILKKLLSNNLQEILNKNT